MANYWLLSIGINQYRFLPPLSFAQRDAELLHEFLINAAGFAANRCRLITDHVTIVSSDSRFPTAQNIQNQLAHYQQQIASEDVLLCFFSGYGMQVQGQDYLLPIEAEPRQIATAGIAVELLLQTLKSLPTQNIVLLLDANRSQLGLEQNGFGGQTAQLAQELGIAALISCQPHQFSHEPLTLRQGIFTAALIAALQEGCLTLEQLTATLQERLPSLCEEFWRPRQDLLSVVPSHLRYQMILPNQVQGKPAAKRAGVASGQVESAALLSRQLAFLSRVGSNFKQTMTGWLTPGSDPAAAPLAATATAMAQPMTYSMGASSDGDDSIALSDEFFLRRLLVQGGLIAGILLFGVILRNSGALINSSNRVFDRDITPAPAPVAPSQPAVPGSASNPAASLTPTESAIVDPELLLQSAQTAFEAQQYEDANRQLAQIPKAERTPVHNQLLEQINQALLNQAKTMLIRTREPVTQNQVSDLVEAIKIARLIKADQPLFQESQQNINRWSRVILDMAQGRAARANGSSAMDATNNYSAAISAARLVPTDQSEVYEQAQQAVALWSQQIFNLANSRAANGELDLAIQIGELVPPNTPVYASVQGAIANWRNQPAPAVEQSVEQPVVEQSFVEQSVVEQPVVEQFAVEQPEIEAPLIEAPAEESVPEVAPEFAPEDIN